MVNYNPVSTVMSHIVTYVSAADTYAYKLYLFVSNKTGFQFKFFNP